MSHLYNIANAEKLRFDLILETYLKCFFIIDKDINFFILYFYIINFILSIKILILAFENPGLLYEWFIGNRKERSC